MFLISPFENKKTINVAEAIKTLKGVSKAHTQLYNRIFIDNKEFNIDLSKEFYDQADDIIFTVDNINDFIDWLELNAKEDDFINVKFINDQCNFHN